MKENEENLKTKEKFRKIFYVKNWGMTHMFKTLTLALVINHLI